MPGPVNTSRPASTASRWAASTACPGSTTGTTPSSNCRANSMIARVVGRHGHDRAGPVTGQHVVGHPDRHGAIVDGVGGHRAGEDARLLLGQIGAVQVALARGLLAVGPNRVGLGRLGESGDQRMFRGHDHVGGAVERVGPGGEDPQHVIAGKLGKATGRPVVAPGLELLRVRLAAGPRLAADEKVDLGSRAAADPVALQGLDAVGPVEPGQIALQPVGIGRDP